MVSIEFRATSMSCGGCTANLRIIKELDGNWAGSYRDHQIFGIHDMSWHHDIQGFIAGQIL
jgi:hypothetical protein